MQNDPEVISLCEYLMSQLQPVQNSVLLQGSAALEVIAATNDSNERTLAALQDLQQWETMWDAFQSMPFLRFVLGPLRRYWAKKLRSKWKARFPILSRSTTNSIP